LAGIGRNLKLFAAMDGGKRALMIEAGVCLLLARLWLMIVPFRKVARHLGTLTGATGQLAPAARPDRSADALRAHAIGQAVGRVARNVPFRAVCLQQAVAGKMMLRRRRIDAALHFGVALAQAPGETMEAHAWLDAGSTRVTGYPVEPRFVEVACFI